MVNFEMLLTVVYVIAAMLGCILAGAGITFVFLRHFGEDEICIEVPDCYREGRANDPAFRVEVGCDDCEYEGSCKESHQQAWVTHCFSAPAGRSNAASGPGELGVSGLPKNCKAYCIGDQKHCDYCGLVWDNNDPDPPACVNEAPVTKQEGIEIFEKLQEDLKK